MTWSAEHYYLTFAAAYVRGTMEVEILSELPERSFRAPLDELSEVELQDIIVLGAAAGLRIHRFKRTELPRVRRVLGMLRSIAPADLLDVGTGRGVFLWPLLDTFPGLPVTAIDPLEHRIETLEAVRRGGVDNLDAKQKDITATDFETDQFDVVTLLEVLEHLRNPTEALIEAVRIARRFVILSVPSKEDDNPEHLHLLDETKLREMFAATGISKQPKFGYVPGHLIAVANVEKQ